MCPSSKSTHAQTPGTVHENENFYKIITYNVVARDYAYINQSLPDLIILDEAQRIKNWDTKISRAVKRLEAPYRLALTGTPLENKLEDLYSIVQFLDQYLLCTTLPAVAPPSGEGRIWRRAWLPPPG